MLYTTKSILYNSVLQMAQRTRARLDFLLFLLLLSDDNTHPSHTRTKHETGSGLGH